MLLLDTCGAMGGVAVARLGDGTQKPAELVAERLLPGRETQERLMAAIAEVLAEAGLEAGRLDVVAVVTGPGSFTGVRIGLAAAKGLAESLGIPLVAISRLAVLAAQAGNTGEVQSWIDAGRGDIFVGRYSAGVCLDERMLPGVAAVEAAGENVLVMEERLAALLPGAILVQPVSVRQALPLVAELARKGQFADAALLEANYLRVPDAQLALEAAKLEVASAGAKA